MASGNRNSKRLRRIFFTTSDGRRKSVRLGSMTDRQFVKIEPKIKDLATAAKLGITPSEESSRWLATVDGELRNRLAKVGLADVRDSTLLAEFIESFIQRRINVVKESTILVDRLAQRSLVSFFGEKKTLLTITEGDAEDFRNFLLGNGLSEATTRKRCQIASKICKYAVRHKLIDADPFRSVPTNSIATKHTAYISEADAYKVMAELPNCQWRLLFALSRWGGLRVGSEVRRLTWADIDWERSRFNVHSPKTEHHHGRATRLVPLFHQLSGLLQERFEEAEEGELHVLPMLKKCTDAALRQHLIRAIERAGLEQWPRLWHSMRATRQTELANVWPSFKVCAWMGNNEDIAKKHYYRVTDEDYKKSGAKTGAASACTKQQHPANGFSTKGKITCFAGACV